MGNRVLFVSEQYLRDHADISESINSKSIITAIEEAQSFYLSAVIGDKFLNKLYEEVTTGTFLPNHKNLLDTYIQPFVYAQAMAVLVSKIPFRVGNAGVTKDSNSDNKRLVDYYTNLTGLSLRRLTEHLCRHLSLYTEWLSNVEGIKPHLSASDSTSIFLGTQYKTKYPVDKGWRR